MKVRIKRLHPDAVVPKYAKPGDAGMDLTAIGMEREWDVVTYKTGLALEIPKGHVGLLFPRSSVYKTSMIMSNCVGVIDSGYRGEIMLKFRDQWRDYSSRYEVGDRVGQLIIMPYPQVELEEVDNLSSTDRGSGGYGSTGS
jgi:dUTP pyrophosphatase|tara:strand:+ start:288 stop:710 length:423 start_codon:yes stop_codon:yes gene_type:complete